MKTSDLIGAALDWAVATAGGGGGYDKHSVNIFCDGYAHFPTMFRSSTEWSVGGPIIEREGIEVFCNLSAEQAARFKDARADWRACMNRGRSNHYYGPTPLIAAMRCFVASKLGDEVDVPKELTCS